MSLDPGARCAKHPAVAAVDTCQRCGAFVCGECTNIRDEDVYCADCVKLLDRRIPSRAPGALALTIGALFSQVVAALLPFGFYLGAFVLVGGSAIALALMLRERGDGDPRARKLTYRLAWAALAFNGLIAIGLVAMLMLAMLSGGAGR
jgi:hypothetical protein